MTTTTKHGSSRDIEKNSTSTSRKTRALGIQLRQHRTAVVLIVLAAVSATFYIVEPLFLTPLNLSNLALQTMVTAVLALSVTFVLLLGEIDLSVAAIGGSAAALMGNLSVIHRVNTWLALAMAVAAGAIFGALQGVVVNFGPPSFMVTLATSIALGGVLLLLLPESGAIDLSQSDVGSLTQTFLAPAASWVLLIVAVGVLLWLQLSGRDAVKLKSNTGRFSPTRINRAFLGPFTLLCVGAAAIVYLGQSRGVPLALVLTILLFAIGSYATSQTAFGTSIYAVGGNKQASRRAGIKVARVTIICFGLAGGLAALAGMLASARVLGVSNQSGGSYLLLQAIAAAVIGGVSLFGGRGTVWAALLGALIIGSISNGMDLLGVGTESKLLITGVILLLAVVLDAVAGRGQFRPVRE